MKMVGARVHQDKVKELNPLPLVLCCMECNNKDPAGTKYLGKNGFNLSYCWSLVMPGCYLYTGQKWVNSL